MAGSMNRLHDLLPRIIHELDEELLVGVLGLDNWGYITMGPDRNPDSMPSDGWGLFHPPEYYYYMDQPSTTTTPATTPGAVGNMPASSRGRRRGAPSVAPRCSGGGVHSGRKCTRTS